ncbi:MAG: hypothetical protein WAL38_24880, partial [Solirubrobacteraceae bacterium]
MDTLADVSQARAVGGLCRVKPSTVVCDARGQRSMAVTQAELDLRGATRVCCDVLDRLGTGEVDSRLCFFDTTRRGPFKARVDRAARRLRAQRSREAEVGELRRIGPADDVAHRVECRPCTSFQPGERFRDRGWDSGIFLCECELDDQRHQLVLD